MATQRPPAYLSWSSGKDSAFALYEVNRLGLADVKGLITTVNEAFDRVAMHGVRRSILNRQVEAAGLASVQVDLPYPCSNEVYEERMGQAVEEIKRDGIRHVIFGDLFLEDIRAYREKQMAACDMTPLFPLWERDTHRLARDMIGSGLEAYIACLDPKHLPQSFAGRRFDEDFLRDLPEGVDPCGERGEFHTVVAGGPMFQSGLRLKPGEVVQRDGFVFADFEAL